MKTGNLIFLAVLAFGTLLSLPGPASAIPSEVAQTANEVATAESSKPLSFWERLYQGLLLTLVYGGIGIIMAVLGFKVFDWITPKIDIQRELAEKHNIAVAVVCAAIILGVCFIVAHVVE